MAKRPIKGERLSIAAKDWSDVLNMLGEWRSKSKGIGQALPKSEYWNGFNRSGVDLPAGSVVGVQDVAAFDTSNGFSDGQKFTQQFLFRKPTAEDIASGNIGITVGPAKDDAFVSVAHVGTSFAQINFASSGHTSAVAEVDSIKLKSASSGPFSIVQAFAGGSTLGSITGDATGVVFRSGRASNITFQAPSGGIPAATSFTPGSATVDILVRDTTDDEWKSSGTATVYNFATSAICDEGLRLGWAVFDGRDYVAISKLCGDERTYADADTL